MAQKNSDNSEYMIEIYRLFHLLRQAADAVHKAREVELKKYKITPEQAGALVCIRSLGNKATPAELSRWLFRERNSVTILLNRMNELGLINKKTDSNRKNSIKLSLTKKGYEAYKHSIEFKSFSSIVDVLPGRKRAQLWKLLQTVRLKVFEDLVIDPGVYSGILTKPIAIDTSASEVNCNNTKV
jgi:DNA-binding MarR family transcriptional regulator